jgi:hypothetical protein
MTSKSIFGQHCRSNELQSLAAALCRGGSKRTPSLADAKREAEAAAMAAAAMAAARGTWRGGRAAGRKQVVVAAARVAAARVAAACGESRWSAMGGAGHLLR